MEKTLQELLAPYSLGDKTLPESILKDLAGYEHISLEDVELARAIIGAKREKEFLLEEQVKLRKAEETRRFLTQEQWSTRQTEDFIEWRMSSTLTRPFRLDAENEPLYRMLIAYFSKDPSFVILAQKAQVQNPSLEKGIFLGGAVGVGKSLFMELFSKNHRQSYQIVNAAKIADDWLELGDSWLELLTVPAELPANDASNFFQRRLGLCVDDLGAEMGKNAFGNKKNVLGSLIEMRYSAKTTGPLFHMTTNLTAGQIKEFYGDRVGSRLREMMNVIILKGADRRK